MNEPSSVMVANSGSKVLTLRHFEHLSNDETALVLGLTKKAASNRYIRALKRLKEVLSSIPGMNEGW